MTILITRPEPDASRLAGRLHKSGFESLIEPLMVVEAIDGDKALSFDGVQAIALTSANGARAIAKVTTERSKPVFAVGAATATAAKEVGFKFVHSAGGDVDQLAGLIGTILDPDDGRILHIAGKIVAGDLQDLLGSFGFQVVRHVLYGAEPAKAFSPTCLEALRRGSLSAVTLYSPRTAKIFASLVIEAGLLDAAKTMVCFALSENVAGAVIALPFREVLIAAAPNEDALMELIEGD